MALIKSWTGILCVTNNPTCVTSTATPKVIFQLVSRRTTLSLELKPPLTGNNCFSPWLCADPKEEQEEDEVQQQCITAAAICEELQIADPTSKLSPETDLQ